jgi:hypothetical protein
MEQYDVINHLNKLEKEKNTHYLAWLYVEKLNKDVGLSDATIEELKAKISSKIAQCDRFIKDYTKLL